MFDCANVEIRELLPELVAGTLDEDARLFISFHLDEMKCPWCLANRDDLSSAEQGAELELLIERISDIASPCSS